MAVGTTHKNVMSLCSRWGQAGRGQRRLGRGELGSERLESGILFPLRPAGYPAGDPLFAPSVKRRVTIVSALPTLSEGSAGTPEALWGLCLGRCTLSPTRPSPPASPPPRSL